MQWILLVTTWHLFPSAAFLIYRKPRCETEWSRRLLSFLVPKKATGRHTLLFFWLLACLRMKLTLREAKKREADWVPGDMPKPLNHYKANSPLGLANIQDQKKSFLFKPFWVGFLLPCKICSWSLAFLLFIRWRFLNNKMIWGRGKGTTGFFLWWRKFSTVTLASYLQTWHFIPTVPGKESQSSGP